ncbi:hypothetical protein [Desulfosoma sp.]
MPAQWCGPRLRRLVAFGVAAVLLLANQVRPAHGQEPGGAPAFLDGVTSWLAEHGQLQGRIVGYGFAQQPRYGWQNPENQILDIPTSGATVAFRPDVHVAYEWVEASVRPRWEWQYRRWSEGEKEGEDSWDEEAFVNEWAVRLRPVESIMLSYGRENLQWGPSSFLSPTNPFFRDNGRSNPKQEVGGMDFFRLVWTPSLTWNFSFMANTDEGRQDFVTPFQRVYAIKGDYTGHRWYASGVFSWKEEAEGHPVFGGYAGATVGEGLLVYGEGTFQRGVTGFYAEPEVKSPFGLALVQSKAHQDFWNTTWLLGMSYTTRWGPTGVVEYVSHGAGYDDEEWERFLTLGKRAATSLSQAGPTQKLARQILYRSLDPELRLLRRHYLMVQYQQADIYRGHLDVVVRYAVNLDDGSSRINPILDYELSDHWILFLVGTKTFGGGSWGWGSRGASDETEFRRLGDYSFWLGLEYVF